MRKCTHCGTKDNLQKNRSICKSCHAQKNKEWWNNLSTEEKRRRNKKNYISHKKIIEKKSSEDIDFCIIQWILRWQQRSDKNNRFAGRKELVINDLVELAKHGLKVFPYMDFSIVNKHSKKAFWASVDKIDPSKDYSDIKNLQFVPLWLNSAKLDLMEQELNELMISYLKTRYNE